MAEIKTIAGPQIGQIPESKPALGIDATEAILRDDQKAIATETDTKSLHKSPLPKGISEQLRMLFPQEKTGSIDNLREYILNLTNHIAGASSLVTFLLQFVFKDGNPIKNLFEKFSKQATVVAFGTNGAVCASDAYQRGDHAFIGPQLLDIAIPYLSESKTLTLNRGVPVGLYNALAELKSLAGKKSYSSFSENIKYLTIGLKKFWKEFRKAPLGTMGNFGKGPGGVFYGLLTSIAPVISITTGLKKIPALLRHTGGIGVEIAKMQPSRLAKGQWRYFSSGVFMFASSLVDLCGKLIPVFEKKATYLNWALNLCGKRLWLNSIKQGELNSDSEHRKVSLAQLPQLAAQELFGMGDDKKMPKLQAA